nr:MAG TPA: hypothetical protein [Caudoviricetes sp.]
MELNFISYSITHDNSNLNTTRRDKIPSGSKENE